MAGRLDYVGGRWITSTGGPAADGLTGRCRRPKRLGHEQRTQARERARQLLQLCWQHRSPWTEARAAAWQAVLRYITREGRDWSQALAPWRRLDPVQARAWVYAQLQPWPQRERSGRVLP